MILSLLLTAAAPQLDAPASTRGLYLQLIHQARSDGRSRAAIAYLDDFDRRYPDDTDARLLRIDSLLDLGDVTGAEAAASTLPASAAASGARGHLLAARGRWAEAVPFYEAARQANPADPLPRNALGYAQLRAGRTADAIETLRAAADLAPADPVIRNNLLLALTIGGRRAEADAALRRIRDPEARAALRSRIAAEAARLARKGS